MSQKNHPVSTEAVEIAAQDDWSVTVTPQATGRPITFPIAPPTRIRVVDERHDSLPQYSSAAAPWARGARLRDVITYETSAPDSLVPSSLRLKAAPGQAPPLAIGRDYEADLRWGTIGLAKGSPFADAPIWIDYECELSRLDSVVADSAGNLAIRAGSPHVATPLPPELASGETRLANIWVRPRQQRLDNDSLYPIALPAAPPQFSPNPPAAQERLLPKTWAKLQDGRPLRLLAWGDSVTVGAQASRVENRYQDLFAARLRAQFPQVEIELTTVAWGGKNSASFLAEPPGSEHNFAEKVLDWNPDLVVTEFVNDSGLDQGEVDERYATLLARFTQIGAEWIVLTPHFVWGEWMGVGQAKVTSDPRPYVAALRRFATQRDSLGFALADAASLWEYLMSQGIPYQTLLSNCLNHPDDRGHALFADALMGLFGG